MTKDDVVAWAKEFIGEGNYAVVYKRQGVDSSEQKIAAPKITPIVTNRNAQSDFLKEIKETAVKPIEPVFVDFSKDMSRFQLAEGVDVLYKKNDINDVFTLEFIYNTGTEDNPAIGLASDYLQYLGTADKSAEEIAARMYELACSFYFMAGANQTTVGLTGLSENMAEALSIVRELIDGAVGNDSILANLKADEFKSRANAKTNQRSCYSALSSYATYGPEFIKKTRLSNEAVAAITSDELLKLVRDVVANGCEVIYYGPMSEAQVKAAVPFEGSYQQLPERYPAMQQTPAPKVLLAQYDAKQLYYTQYSNRGEKYDPASEPVRSLYNEYFGGGMNSIVFQEMREARGLAYSANARLRNPYSADGTFAFSAFIATQNDKMRQAIEAFDDIINNMPESEAAFTIAKDAIDSRIRTQRTTGAGVLRAYRNCRRMGIEEPTDKAVFEALPNLTLADVKATQEQWVKGRVYTYAILGDIKDLDVNFLKTLGPVETVSLEDIFGY